MSASPFDEIPAISSFQDATNDWRRQPGALDRDMPQRPPRRPTGLAQPVGVRYNPLSPGTYHRMIATNGWSKASWGRSRHGGGRERRGGSRSRNGTRTEEDRDD